MSEFVSNCLEMLFDLTMTLGIPSYALAIFLVAFIIRMVLLPLNINQMRSSVAMQQIQPQLKELQEKYASRPDVLNQKMMELYRDYEVNPMAGCLPMLIQFPILIGLYQGLRVFVPAHPEYYNFLWISDLNQIDTTYIMVVLVLVSTFLQSFVITGKPTQAMQWYMLIAMPAMMAWMAAKFPAFLCIYWLSITIISILQQLIINRPVKAKLEKRSAELAEERKKRAEQRHGKSSGRRSQESANEEAEAELASNRASRRAQRKAKGENPEAAESVGEEAGSQPAEPAERVHKKRRRRR